MNREHSLFFPQELLLPMRPKTRQPPCYPPVFGRIWFWGPVIWPRGEKGSINTLHRLSRSFSAGIFWAPTVDKVPRVRGRDGMGKWTWPVRRGLYISSAVYRERPSLVVDHCYSWGFPGGSVVESPPANAGDSGSIPGLGRCPGGGHGNRLRYSCLENPVDRGAWWATVHGVTKSRTRLNESIVTGTVTWKKGKFSVSLAWKTFTLSWSTSPLPLVIASEKRHTLPPTVGQGSQQVSCPASIIAFFPSVGKKSDSIGLEKNVQEASSYIS